jgi:hypothetical protein
MPQNHDEGLRTILIHHARNLLRITSIPSRREVNDFRSLIRNKLEGGGIDIGLLLREIQERARLCAETVEKKDPSLHEYYMAVFVETTFLLSAITTDHWPFPPRMAETA